MSEDKYAATARGIVGPMMLALPMTLDMSMTIVDTIAAALRKAEADASETLARRALAELLQPFNTINCGDESQCARNVERTLADAKMPTNKLPPYYFWTAREHADGEDK